MTSEAVGAIEDGLRRLGTPERAAREQRYLKSSLVHWGVSVPDVRKTVRAEYRARKPGHDELLALVGELWASEVYERRAAAVELLSVGEAQLRAADLACVERLIREGAMWSLVDPLAGDVAGRVVLRTPGAATILDRWAADGDFWIRRGALLGLLRGIRAGAPDLARFTAYADAMLDEKEFFIRKAVGWVARELSTRDSAFIVAWAQPRLARMSAVTYREVVRRLPEADAARLAALRG